MLPDEPQGIVIPMIADMKAGSVTIDEVVKLRVALNNSINTLNRLIRSEQGLRSFYEGELEAAEEAKAILSQIIKREN